ncbi:hypothetical protein CYMTET_25144, partial [Cymbomonas tetramitiformis]
RVEGKAPPPPKTKKAPSEQVVKGENGFAQLMIGLGVRGQPIAAYGGRASIGAADTAGHEHNLVQEEAPEYRVSTSIGAADEGKELATLNIRTERSVEEQLRLGRESWWKADAAFHKKVEDTFGELDAIGPKEKGQAKPSAPLPASERGPLERDKRITKGGKVNRGGDAAEGPATAKGPLKMQPVKRLTAMERERQKLERELEEMQRERRELCLGVGVHRMEDVDEDGAAEPAGLSRGNNFMWCTEAMSEVKAEVKAGIGDFLGDSSNAKTAKTPRSTRVNATAPVKRGPPPDHAKSPVSSDRAAEKRKEADTALLAEKQDYMHKTPEEMARALACRWIHMGKWDGIRAITTKMKLPRGTPLGVEQVLFILQKKGLLQAWLSKTCPLAIQQAIRQLA